MARLVALSCFVLIVSCTLLDDENEWDNPIDQQGNNWHPPVVTAMADTVVLIRDTVYLRVEGSDANGSIVKYQWSLDYGKTWPKESDTSGILKWYFDKINVGVNVFMVRAIDNDSLVSSPDTAEITVELGAPTIDSIPDKVVAIKDSVILQVSGSDVNGEITKFLWAIDNDSDWTHETGADGTLKTYFPLGSQGIHPVRVKAIDDDTVESEIESFSIDVRLYKPVVSLNDKEQVNINDSLTLSATGSDTNGVVVKYLWALDGTNFTDTTDKNSVTLVYNTDSTFIVRVIVIDDDGFVSKAAQTAITVTLDPPVLTPVNNSFVSQLDTVKVTVTAEDTNATGSIEKYYWDTGGDGWDDSTNTDTPSYSFFYPDGGPLTVIWGARDDDNLLSTDTFYILFNRVPDSVTMLEPVDNAKASFTEFDTASLTGSVLMRFSGSDPDGNADTLTYTLYLGEDNNNLEKIYEGRDTGYTKDELDTSTTYYWKLKVRDLHGDSAVNTGQFTTPYVDLIPPVLTLKGDNPLMLTLGVKFKDPGATAVDNFEGDISDKITVSGDVNTSKAGTYVLTYSVADSTGNDTSTTREVIVEDYILLEDFERGLLYQTAFGSNFSSLKGDSVGHWRAWTDGVNATFDPDPNADPNDPFKEVVKNGNGFDGSKGFQSSVKISEPLGSYWGVVCYLKEYDKFYDLSKLDSVTFYIKGSGTARVHFTYEAIDTMEDWEQWGYAGKNLELSDSWTKVILNPSDTATYKGLGGSPGEGHTWDNAKARVRRFGFVDVGFGPDDVDISVDEIRFYGDFTDSGLLPNVKY